MSLNFSVQRGSLPNLFHSHAKFNPPNTNHWICKSVLSLPKRLYSPRETQEAVPTSKFAKICPIPSMNMSLPPEWIYGPM